MGWRSQVAEHGNESEVRAGPRLSRTGFDARDSWYPYRTRSTDSESYVLGVLAHRLINGEALCGAERPGQTPLASTGMPKSVVRTKGRPAKAELKAHVKANQNCALLGRSDALTFFQSGTVRRGVV
jgi:hypothetical protein